DDRVRDAFDPDAGPLASPTFLADDRLDRVDLVRTGVFAKAEEDHPPRIRHAPTLRGRGQTQHQMCAVIETRRPRCIPGSLNRPEASANRSAGSDPGVRPEETWPA